MTPDGLILNAWNIQEQAKPAQDGGLINDTFVVGSPPSGILQRVNPIFGPDVHLDIEAITAHLERKGMLTPMNTNVLRQGTRACTQHTHPGADTSPAAARLQRNTAAVCGASPARCEGSRAAFAIWRES